MHSNQSQWNPDEIIDTRKLQIHALKEFMQSLNYQYSPESLWVCPYFYSDHHSNKGRQYVSFNSAIKLYNGNTAKCVFGRPPHTLSIWSFNDYYISKAKASRILINLKLQLCKQTKTIICQDHRVKFTLPSYKKLFLGNKHL